MNLTVYEFAFPHRVELVFAVVDVRIVLSNLSVFASTLVMNASRVAIESRPYVLECLEDKLITGS